MLTTDLKMSIRQLRKMPAFLLTATLTLALGLGATSAIFSLVHQLLLQSLPIKDPAQLWRIGDIENCCINGGLPSIPGRTDDWSIFSYEQYKQFRDNTPEFASLAAFQAGEDQVAAHRAGSGEIARSLWVEYLSGNAFETLGVVPVLGRAFASSDDTRASAAVAILSYPAFRDKFGGDRSIVGSTLYLDGAPFTVIGIAPPSFHGEQIRPNAPSVWVPINARPLVGDKDALLDHPELQWLNVIGRVRPGINISQLETQVQSELQRFLHSPLAKVSPADARFIPRQHLRLSPGGGGVRRMQQDYQSGLNLLMWISGFVLLIACANLANLMLVKFTGQLKQVAVQAALGATQGRLVRQAFVQSLLIAVLGGLAALPVAWAGAALILKLAFQQDLVGISPEPSSVVMAFAFSAAALTGVLFGVAPAWLVSRVSSVEVLRGANRATGRQTNWAQRVLIVTQAAVSVVLVCAAGLLILSLRSMMQQPLGFQTAHRYVINLDPQTAGFRPDQLDEMYRRLESNLESIPGVKQVGYGLYTPLEGYDWNIGVQIAGQHPRVSRPDNSAGWNRVNEHYFEAIGTPLRTGRFFTASDDRSGRPVAIVNQAFVHHFLHDRNPLGTHFGDWEQVNSMYEIVGVVDDAQYWGSKDKIRPMFFLPAKQWNRLPGASARDADYERFLNTSHYMTSVVIETIAADMNLESQFRRAVADISPDLVINRFEPFEHQVKLAFSQQDMLVKLTSLFGTVALVLAGVGLYGVTAYGVAQRTVEIGVRVALGATKWRIRRFILQGAFTHVSIGLLIGIPAAIANAQLMSSHLFGVEAYDPGVILSAVLVLGLVASLAALLPARRASTIEPMRALREQ